jgi:TetR/AcrR family transcriptional regulator, mexJK operon transcriptional repressor
MGEERRRGRPAGMTEGDLLAVARAVFLERGYAATTTDEIAARARISKASLYREHPSKAALFSAVVSDWAAAGRDAMRPALAQLVEGNDVGADLVDLARTIRAGVLSADVLGMRRLVTSEAARHPAIAALYLAESWERNINDLADAFRALNRQGRLRVVDARLAADQFTWLTIGAPLNAQLLAPASKQDTTPTTTSAVQLFLSGYSAVVDAPSP